MRLALEEVPKELFQQLEERDAGFFTAARRQGHTNIVADTPVVRMAPHILKRRCEEAALVTIAVKRRRRFKSAQ